MTTGTEMEELKKLSFSQSIGLKEIPTPLREGELSENFRTDLFNLVHERLIKNHPGRVSFREKTKELHFAKSLYSIFFKKPMDEFNGSINVNIRYVKNIIIKGPYNFVLDFILFMVRGNFFPETSTLIPFYMKTHLLAYELIEEHQVIKPRSNKEESKAYLEALESTKANSFNEAYKNLITAGDRLMEGKDKESIAASIHCLESIAKQTTGNENAILPQLIKNNQLKNATNIDGKILTSLDKLYAYCSDVARHGNSDDKTESIDLDSYDAQFMLSTCSSFASYIINKNLKVEKESK